MTGFDVERVVKFEIEQLKEELTHCNYDFDNYKDCSSRLIDALELRIDQLKDKLQDINNEVTEY
jgi:hypothetical protein